MSLFRVDAQKLEEWARAQNPNSLVEFSSREGEVEGILKDIAERAGGKGDFSYSCFFAVGLFRLLELSNATEPAVLEKVWLPISSLVYIFSRVFQTLSLSLICIVNTFISLIEWFDSFFWLRIHVSH